MGYKFLFHLAVSARARLTGDSILKFQKVKVQDAYVLGANFGLKCKVQQVCPAAAATAHRERKGWRVRTLQSRETEVTRTMATPRCSSPPLPCGLGYHVLIHPLPPSLSRFPVPILPALSTDNNKEASVARWMCWDLGSLLTRARSAYTPSDKRTTRSVLRRSRAGVPLPPRKHGRSSASNAVQSSPGPGTDLPPPLALLLSLSLPLSCPLAHLHISQFSSPSV